MYTYAHSKMLLIPQDFLEACEEGNVSQVISFIKEGVNIEATNYVSYIVKIIKIPREVIAIVDTVVLTH